MLIVDTQGSTFFCLPFFVYASSDVPEDYLAVYSDPTDEAGDCLQKRLRMTRWPEAAPTSDWQYGVPLELARLEAAMLIVDTQGSTFFCLPFFCLCVIGCSRGLFSGLLRFHR